VTIIDGLHYTNGSANHVDISFRSDPENGHTEVNVGVSGKEATHDALTEILKFYLGPEFCPEVLDMDFGDLVKFCGEHARANRIRWEQKEDLVGHGILVDFKNYLLNRGEEVRLFPGWQK
jgi:hypothetical protein